jgi:PTH2 family peptidyl-tRNA hydrolase
LDEVKQVIVVRADLKMGKGKLAAQVAHGAVEAVLKVLESNRSEWLEWLQEWRRQGQKKVVVRVQGEDELVRVYREAVERGLPAVLVIDAGRTQLEPGTKTVAAIGPAPSSILDQITGRLKLL